MDFRGYEFVRGGGAPTRSHQIAAAHAAYRVGNSAVVHGRHVPGKHPRQQHYMAAHQVAQQAAVRQAAEERRVKARRTHPATKQLQRDVRVALHTDDGDLLTAKPVPLPKKLRFPGALTILSAARKKAMSRMDVARFNISTLLCNKDGVKAPPEKAPQLEGGGFAKDYKVDFAKELDEEVYTFVGMFGQFCADKNPQFPAMTRQEHLEIYTALRRVCNCLARLLEGRFFRAETFNARLVKEIRIAERAEELRQKELHRKRMEREERQRLRRTHRYERQRQEADARRMQWFYEVGGRMNGSATDDFEFNDYEDSQRDVYGEYLDYNAMGYGDEDYGGYGETTGDDDSMEEEEDEEDEPVLSCPNLNSLQIIGLDRVEDGSNIVNALLRKTIQMLIEHSKTPKSCPLARLQRYLLFVDDMKSVRAVLQFEIIWAAICDAEGLPHYPRWIDCKNTARKSTARKKTRPSAAKIKFSESCKRPASEGAGEDGGQKKRMARSVKKPSQSTNTGSSST